MLHWLIIVQFIHKFVKRNVFYAKVFQNIMPLAKIVFGKTTDIFLAFNVKSCGFLYDKRILHISKIFVYRIITYNMIFHTDEFR